MGIEKTIQGEVISEFEVDGKSARIIRLQVGDIDPADLEAHAKNLAESNFRLLDNVKNPEGRAKVRERMFKTRERLRRVPVIGKAFGDSKFLDGLLQRVYPDYSLEEHVRGYRDKSFPKLMNEGHLLGIEIDGRIVAVQGVRNLGKTESGREVYEFAKASTLDDYKGRKLNPRLKEAVFGQVMGTDAEALWASASVNTDHLANFAKRGWHVVEMDDPHEAVKVLYQHNAEYSEVMKKQGYKAIYLDPKVDKISFE